MTPRIQLAVPGHVAGISDVCTAGYWAAYKDGIYPDSYIQRIVDEFYNHERILREVTETSPEWGGYFVALDEGTVIGAGGGGMISQEAGEIFVLYMDPERRNEGIGSMLLQAITDQQKALGAKEQWVSTAKGNKKGIPFYEARGFEFQYEKPGYGNIEGENHTSLRFMRMI